MSGLFDDKIWAKIGKVGVFVGIIVGVAKLSFDIYDRSNGPRLGGWIRIQSYEISPYLYEQLRRPHIDVYSLSNQIAAALPDATKHLATLSNINDSVIRAIAFAPADLEMKMFYMDMPNMVHARVENSGSQTARDVKIPIGGFGLAEILTGPGWAAKLPPFGWTNALSLGDIFAGGSVELLIWPKGLQMWSYDPAATLAVVHSNGTGHLYRVHEFLGRIADISFWLDRVGYWTRVFWVTVTALLILFLVRRFKKRTLVGKQDAPDGLIKTG